MVTARNYITNMTSAVAYQSYKNNVTNTAIKAPNVHFKAKNPFMDLSVANGNYNLAAIKIKSTEDTITKIPKGLRKIFNELKDETGESFVNKAYSKIKTYMKLDGIAPDKIEKSGPDKADKNGVHSIIEGGYNPRSNTIIYSDGFFNKFQKHEQINFLSHELKHAEQASKIIRSGMISRYAGTWAKFQVSDILQNPLNTKAQIALKQARENGKLTEFVTGIMQRCKELTLNDMQKGHANTLKLPQYKEGTTGYKQGQKYFEAYKLYSNDIYSSDYKDNPIEVEAYTFGNKIEKYFNNYNKCA